MKFRVLGAQIGLGIVLLITGRAQAESAGVAGANAPLAAEPAPQVAAPAQPPPAEPPPAEPPPAEPPPTVTHAVAAPAAESITQEGDEAPPPAHEAEGQDNFGFGAQIGFDNPNGLTVRTGGHAISLEVTAGFLPYLLSYGTSQHPELKFLFPFEVTPQLVIHAVTFKNGVSGAALFGYRYNVALGHGATLGGQIEKRIAKKVVVEGLLGFSYYPDAADRLRGEHVPADTSFNFPPQISEGISVGLLFYP